MANSNIVSHQGFSRSEWVKSLSILGIGWRYDDKFRAEVRELAAAMANRLPPVASAPSGRLQVSTVSLASQGSGILFGDAYPSPTTWLDRNDRIRRRNNSEISERLSAMKIEGLLRILGDQIQVPDEETYDLFAQDLPSHSLGFIDPKATALELAIAGRDLTIHQSPGVLESNRAGGTTGAVVWKITPLFAEWISSPDKNPLFTLGLLSSSSHVIELGCGISALVGLLLGPHITRIVLTDQAYVAKIVEQNITENDRSSSSKPSPPKRGGRPSPSSKGSGHASVAQQKQPGRIHFTPLDWETDIPAPALTFSASAKSFDAVVACDCIYNEALIDPFVSACADVCWLRAAEADPGLEPCVCVVAQQLRDPEIFEAWLTRFAESFHVYRVPNEMLPNGLRSSSGFVVHIGVLKGAIPASGEN